MCHDDTSNHKGLVFYQPIDCGKAKSTRGPSAQLKRHDSVTNSTSVDSLDAKKQKKSE